MVTIETSGKSHLDIAKAAIEGGASIIQYRDKHASSRKLFEDALELRKLTADAGALLIINDRADIALAVEADGVHLGQNDLSLAEARRILGDTYIIGISATCFDEAVEAADRGADYIGLGPVFPTPSKDDAAPPIGLEGVAAVRKAVDIPIVAIGGITIDNIEEVVRAGSDGIAVISAVSSAPDMGVAARTITGMIRNVIAK
ncbi:MAG: thiamine phosphate synthase [Candidatus Aquicultor sp.]